MLQFAEKQFEVFSTTTEKPRRILHIGLHAVICVNALTFTSLVHTNLLKCG